MRLPNEPTLKHRRSLKHKFVYNIEDGMRLIKYLNSKNIVALN